MVQQFSVSILDPISDRVSNHDGATEHNPSKTLVNSLKSAHIYWHLRQIRSESPISTTARTPVLLVSVLELTIVLLVHTTPDTTLYFTAFIIGRRRVSEQRVKRFGRLLTSRSCQPTRVKQGMEQRWNAIVVWWGRGDPRENTRPSAASSSKILHAKIRSDPAGDRARIALVGGEQANRSAAVALCTSGGHVVDMLTGAAVAERLVCSPPTKANLAQSPAGANSRIVARGYRGAGRCRWSTWFSQGSSGPPRPFIRALLHTHITSPPSALKPPIASKFVPSSKGLTPNSPVLFVPSSKGLTPNSPVVFVPSSKGLTPNSPVVFVPSSKGLTPNSPVVYTGLHVLQLLRCGVGEVCFVCVCVQGGAPPPGRRRSVGAAIQHQLRSPVVKRPSAAPVTLQGWLHKQGSEGLMLWKKRWFVLSEYCLFYYKGELATILSYMWEGTPRRHLTLGTGKFREFSDLGVVVRLLASHPGEPGSIPAGCLRISALGHRAGRCRWSAGFLGDLPCSPALAFWRRSIPRFTLIGSQHLDVQSPTTLSTHTSPNIVILRTDEGEAKAGGIGRSSRKPADEWHRPARCPRAEIRERPHLAPSGSTATVCSTELDTFLTTLECQLHTPHRESLQPVPSPPLLPPSTRGVVSDGGMSDSGGLVRIQVTERDTATLKLFPHLANVVKTDPGNCFIQFPANSPQVRFMQSIMPPPPLTLPTNNSTKTWIWASNTKSERGKPTNITTPPTRRTDASAIRLSTANPWPFRPPSSQHPAVCQPNNSSEKTPHCKTFCPTSEQPQKVVFDLPSTSDMEVIKQDIQGSGYKVLHIYQFSKKLTNNTDLTKFTLEP
ncbi:hypothetical protein PR048_033608 [Dryococelus australis]|uniref:PH domain-containing protein n=1 Tax=Dryococelus australis TaxID=614101 RepID=A0ABQ9G4W2_9NEOP|nr:hypothetical protein PR048_033608 [Dryococelus australis]